MQRYAVYWAPATEHPLWAAGCGWLGRDARQGWPMKPPARAAVASPWRYGFHATLKAPMTLTEGTDPDDWLTAVCEVAARHAAFAMPTLHVDTLDDFLALRPLQALASDHPLRRLADDCVLELDRWRAPQSAAERARQIQPHFSDRQRRQVERWGYAHVLDDWRLHLTLSDSLPDTAARQAMRLEAAGHFSHALAEPLACDAICVFTEAGPGQPFTLSHRVELGSGRVA